MDVDSVGPSYTILRIKRKRNEEPLDALVVESRRRKKSRGGAGVGVGAFQFAQTVENDAWDDERKKRDIQDQVSRLAAAEAQQPPVPPAVAPTAEPPSPVSARDEIQRRYRVIMQEEPERPPKRRFPSSPPKILSAKDVAAKRAANDKAFTMYDAVLAAEKAAAVGVDEEMDKFMPMLSEYLKINDISVADGSLSSSTSSVDDYVWDVFYHRPTTLSEWNAAAANVATLTGLPASITDPYDSASDSEEEDEADEDSNAEEYYKNDYPDEEDNSEEERSSDDFYDDSEEDNGPYAQDDSDHEWR
ncbi:Iwr1 domain-containing protein [Mycena kentingensis (nom. inval.)]|nr:Iwr1 domain-containing protein [Mycena kentingensis (nom. inval.)]